MTDNRSTPAPALFTAPKEEDEIDLSRIFGTLGRHRSLVAGFAGASLILSSIYAFTLKPVWEGSFQIVLENQEQGSFSRMAALSESNPMLARLVGVGGGESRLKTEVKILESPSVLKPVFDFVKTSKNRAGVDVSKWRYANWVNANLSIKLEKGTSILNIQYRDTDKQLILPVIDRISKEYQAYSGRDRVRGITKGLTYLEDQLTKLRLQSKNSTKEAYAYALANGFNNQESNISFALAANSGSAMKGSAMKGSAFNFTGRNTLQDVLQENSFGRQSNQFKQYEDNGLYARLQNLDVILEQKRSLLKPSDPSIKALQRERSSLEKAINKQTRVHLKVQASDVVQKHQGLMSAAQRDYRTLMGLEEQLLVMQLEKARQSEPWELISTPTLLDIPVAPNKKNIVAIGLLAGLVLGGGAALLVDRRSGLVFDLDELQSLLPCPLLKHLPASTPLAWSDAIDLLASGPLAKGGAGAIALIPVGAISNDQLNAFATELRRALSGRELLVSSDLRQTSACSTQLLLSAPGVATRIELSQLNQKLALQASPLAGWVMLDPKLELG